MSDIICVTNRHLSGDYIYQLHRIVMARPRAVILREKDMPEELYHSLAVMAKELCERQEVPLILHSFPAVALDLGIHALHMPLSLLRKMGGDERAQFRTLGASCHSLADVREAEQLGCTYVTLGHIFETACKPGLLPRGLDMLREVCAASGLPVYAIGGITPETIGAVRAAGAAGGCVMSGLMQCQDPEALLSEFES